MAKAQELPWSKGVRLAACDSFGLVAVDKPVGVLSHPNRRGEKGKALLRLDYDAELQAYVGEGLDPVFLLNRLDSATSGLLLLTARPWVRDPVLEAFERKQVTKRYAALVFGFVRKGSPIWKDRLSVDRKGGGLRAATGGGLSAETRLLGAKAIPGLPAMSMLELQPITGRTHQLRIQCAKRGLPIVGDRTYGDFRKNKAIASAKGIKRLCLHCVGTELVYSIDGKRSRFKAQSPHPF